MLKTINRVILTGFALIFIFSASSLEASPLRSFDEIFPNLSRTQKRRAFSQSGLRNSFSKDETPHYIPASSSGIDLLGAVKERSPTQLVETIIVIPYRGRQLTRLDAYNAMGRIGNIKNHMVYSSSQERFVPVFEESFRFDSARRTRPIPDPPPAMVLPFSDTIYLCLKDTFFGNTYLRGELSASRHGITFNITNFIDVRFLLFPVMRAEKFSTVLYAEPLEEGMLIYGMVGIDIPQFLVSRANLPFNIDRRVTIFMNWLRSGFNTIS